MAGIAKVARIPNNKKFHRISIGSRKVLSCAMRCDAMESGVVLGWKSFKTRIAK
jgi:hypothetical protein